MKWSYVIVGLISLIICWFIAEGFTRITLFWIWHPFAWLKPIFIGIGLLMFLIMLILGAMKDKGSK